MLPTNEAIFLYFMSLHPPLAIRDLQKIVPQFSPEGQMIASKIQGNKNRSYQTPIPECTDMHRYNAAVTAIGQLLNIAPMYSGGAETVLGWFEYFGVMNRSGGFRKST